MPADGGMLIMSTDEREELLSQYPNAKKYIKPLIGAEDFINGKRRWCIWLCNENPKEYLLIPEFKRRIDDLKVVRENS